MKYYIILIFLLAVFPAYAGNPSLMNPETGKPLIWQPGTTIPVFLDTGRLGRYDNETVTLALTYAIALWNEAARGQIQFGEPDSYGSNITENNFLALNPYTIFLKQQQTQLLIVLDDNGKIFEGLGGKTYATTAAGATSLTAVSGSASSPGFRTQTQLYINGSFWSETQKNLGFNALVGVFLHELGHVLGLDHTLANQNDFKAGRYHRVPSMFPYSSATDSCTVYADDLQPDDVATLLWMYDSPDVRLIRGQVLTADLDPQASAVVTVRHADSPLCQTYSQVTQTLCSRRGSGPDSPVFTSSNCFDDNQSGTFTIPVLDDGPYLVDVKKFDENYFRSDSILGALVLNDNGSTDPATFLGAAEFWNFGDTSREGAYTYSPVDTDEEINFVLSATTETITPAPEEILYNLGSFPEDADCQQTAINPAEELGIIESDITNDCTLGEDPSVFGEPLIGLTPLIENPSSSGDETATAGNSGDSNSALKSVMSCSLDQNTNSQQNLFWAIAIFVLLVCKRYKNSFQNRHEQPKIKAARDPKNRSVYGIREDSWETQRRDWIAQ